MDKIPTSGILLKRDSLVQYDNPVLISASQDLKNELQWDMDVDYCQNAKGTNDLAEILDCIIPPRQWEENGLWWWQKVSCKSATRENIINLCNQLDMSLQQQEARYTGICPIRRRLMKQCFDEIIRQVAVDYTNRGLLLLRVRDETNKSLDAYRTVFESGVMFSINKALDAERRHIDTTKRIAEEQKLKHALVKELSQLNATFRQLERDLGSQLDIEKLKNMEEIEFLKKTNQQLKAQYEAIVIIKK